MDERIKVSEHFYLDEFMCGKGMPRFCSYCNGSVVLFPWFLNLLETARSRTPEVKFRINSGTRCLSHNRDVWSQYLFGRLFSQLNEQKDIRKVMEHDTSRHLKDACDIKLLTDNRLLKADAVAAIQETFFEKGKVIVYAEDDGDFVHVDSRFVTLGRLGI